MSTWQDVLSNEKSQPYFKQIMRHIEQQRRSGVSVFPPPQDVFNAFRYTELNEVKVVILGQDPYHGPNQAHGLCFSVKEGVKIPPSLVNIYKELCQDISEFAMPNHGNLTNWARQGVLLLNTVLTVEQGQAHSHAKIGWEKFTDKVMKVINENAQNVVFLLWGSHAQRKGAIIDRSKHHVLCAPHPSPLSAHRGFFGCKHFSQTNQILTQVDAAPINWQV